MCVFNADPNLQMCNFNTKSTDPDHFQQYDDAGRTNAPYTTKTDPSIQGQQPPQRFTIGPLQSPHSTQDT